MGKSLKKDFLIFSIFWSLILIFILGIFTFTFLFNNEMNNMRLYLKERNDNISNFIEGYFKKFLVILDTLSEIDIVKNPINQYDKEIVKDIYRKIMGTDSDVNYIYSGYENGELLIFDYIPPEGFDPRVRPWYIEALKSAPYVSKGIPYTEIKTQEWLISLSKVLYDDNNKITGVIAIDTSVDKINKLISEKESGFQSLNTFIVKDNVIIFHPNKLYLFKPITELITSPIDFNPNNKNGSFDFVFKDQNMIGFYNYLDSVGWFVISTVNKNEIISDILSKMIYPLSILIMLSLTVTFLNSFTLNRNIVNPIIALKNSVVNLTQGIKTIKKSYPNNEIGVIASEIERITETELYKRNIELAKLNEKLKELSIRDKLTGLYNRHKMDEELSKAFYLWERYKKNFSVLMIDIDRFKKVNDEHGHLVGDRILVEFSEILTKNLRKSDVISRWGGEEFLVLMPETSLPQAIEAAEKLRKIVENNTFHENIKITISIGVSDIENSKSIKELINAADINLYKAKHLGRNKVVYSPLNETNI